MNVTSIFAGKNTLTLPNRKVILLPKEIYKVELLNNILLNVLVSNKSDFDNDNALAYSIEGNFLWKIDTSVKDFYYGQKYCPFIDVSTAEHNGYPENFMLYSWCDAALRINPLTGEILERYQTH